MTQVFSKKPICAAVQAAIYSMMLATSVQAAPTGGQVVGGTGSISQSGATTTINQASQNMAINWQSYNLNSNETVNYKQPNVSSISLNRILSNDGSTIAGHINATGQVILVNPNGILFTPTAVINVGGIIASGMDMSPTDFMNGKYMFNAIDGKNGTVVNTGTINASLGGNVALIGKQVKNDGLIAAKLGTVSLAAGKQAVLTFDNGGVLGVRVSKAILQKDIGVDPAVLNSGTIKADGGKVLLTASVSQDVFSLAVNSGNIQEATSVVMNADGSFTLGAGADTVNTGSIDTSSSASGQNGGQVVMLGNNVTSSGTIKADAAEGNGGNIELHSTDTTLLTQNSLTSAQSSNDGVGGIIKVLGDKVGLFDQSTVNVSGADGGGQALIGGDMQGKNQSVQNATRTYVSKGSTIHADALINGDGGKIINWSNDATWFYGTAFARGGKFGGDGGFVETSGHQYLDYKGYVNTESPVGKTGMFLLDPTNIEILNGTGDSTSDGDASNSYFTGCPNNGCGNPVYATDLADYAGPTKIYQSEMQGIAATSNITLQANGGIKIDSLTSGILDLKTSSGNTVSFIADNNNNGSGNFTMDVNNTIQTHGGNVIIRGANVTAGNINTTGDPDSAGGNIKITTTNSTNSTGNITVGSLTSSGGAVSAGTVGGDGGYIQLLTNDSSNNSIDIKGNVTTDGGVDGGAGTTGGNAGKILVQSGSAFNADSITLEGNISAQGGGGDGGSNGNDNVIELDTPLFTTVGDRTITSATTGASGFGGITIRNLDLNTNNSYVSQTNLGGSLSVNAGSGSDINLLSMVDYSNATAGGSVTLSAGNNVSLAGITSSNTNLFNITINADADANGVGDVNLYYYSSNPINIDTNGGLFTVTGDNYVSQSYSGDAHTVNTGSGNAVINLTGFAVLGGMNVGGDLNITTGAADTNTSYSVNQGSNIPTNDILTVNGATTINTIGAGDINLVNNNVMQGGIVLSTTSGNSASLTNIAADTLLGTNKVGLNIGNNLTINATQNLTIDNTLTVGGDAKLNFGTDNNAHTFTANYGLASAATAASSVTGAGGDDTFDIATTGLKLPELDGGAGNNTIKGPNAVNVWNVTGSYIGNLNSNITFKNIQNINGNDGVSTQNTFNIGSSGVIDNIDGGVGDNAYYINGTSAGVSTTAGGTATVGAITAGNGVNTLTEYSGGTINGAVTFGQGANKIYINGTVSGGGAGMASVGSIYTGYGTTGDGNNTIIEYSGGSVAGDIATGVGADQINISGTVTGQISAGTNATGNLGNKITVNTSGSVTNGIVTGSGDDTVTLAGTVTGLIDAGGDTGTGAGDQLIITAAGDRTIDVAGSTILSNNQDYTVKNFQTIYATGTTNNTNGNTLIVDGGHTWSISASNEGNVAGIHFLGFGNLTGGTGSDNFVFGSTGAVTGTVDGGDTTPNNNTLTARTGVTNTWVFNTQDSGNVATNSVIYAKFAEIQNFVGAGTDTANLSGLSNISVDPTNYQGFNNLIGGSSDTLTGHAGLNSTWVINQADAGTLYLGNDPVVANNTQWSFSGFGTIAGSDASSGASVINQFSITTGGSFSGAITGGQDYSSSLTATNTLSALGDAGTANVWKINATDSTLAQTASGATTATTATFNGIQNINDGTSTTSPSTDTNTLTVNGGAAINNIVFGDGANNISVGLATDKKSSTVNSIVTGTGANTITVNALGQVTSSGTSITSGDSTTSAISTITVNGLVKGGILATGTGANVVTVAGLIDGVISGGGLNSTLGITAAGDKTVQLGATRSGANYTANNFGTVNANNTATGNTLISDNSTTNIWNVTTTKNDVSNGTIDTVFTNFANLQGGANYNKFTIDAPIGSIVANGNNGNAITVDAAGSVSGNISAIGTGTNLITLTGAVGGVINGGGSQTTLDVSNSGQNIQIGTTSIPGAPTTNYTVTNIGAITANAGNLIWGSTTDSNWTVSAAGDAGSVGNTNFTGISNLWGGSGNNTFNVDGNIGNITAAGTTDIVYVKAGTTNSITLSGNSNTVTVNGNVNGVINATGSATNKVTVSTTGIVNNAINVTGSGTNEVDLAGTVTGLISGNAANPGQNTIKITAPDKIVQLGTQAVPNEAHDYTVNNFGTIIATNDTNTSPKNGNVLIGYNTAASAWTITNINKGSLTNNSTGVTTNFTNFGNLVGGSQGDSFTLYNNGSSTNGELTGWQDGSNSKNTTFNIVSTALFTYDLLGSPPPNNDTIYNDPNTNTVSVYKFSKTNGKNTQAGSVNNDNVWVIHADTTNPGVTDADLYINGSEFTTFTGSYIKGGSLDDTFIWQSGALAGGISGGNGGTNSLIIPSTNSGSKTIYLGAAGINTTIGTASKMPVLNLQYVVANNADANTIVGSNASTNTWSIQPVSLSGIVTNDASLGGTLPASPTINSGTVSDGTTSTTFTGFSIVQGGTQGVNTYNLLNNGGLTGYIDGNGAGDKLVFDPSMNNTAMTVQLLNSASGSSSSSSLIEVYNVGNVIGTDTNGASNDTLVGMAGTSFSDNWSIDGVNSGSVDNGTGIGTQSVNFLNFGNLKGNSDNDKFAVSGAGSLSGAAYSNGGTDSVNVALTGSGNGQFSFVGDGANSSIALTGAAGDGVYTPPAAGSAYDQVQYTTGGNVYKVNYAQTGTVTDDVTANSLTVNGATTSSTFDLSAPTGGAAGAFNFAVNGRTLVSETGKSQLNVTGLSGNDSISLATGLDLTGMGVDLSAQHVSQTVGSLTADTLNLSGVGTVGTANSPLNIAVNNLDVSNTGAVYLNQQGDLALLGSNINALLDITATGNVTNSSPLTSSGDLVIASTGGDITLSGSNQLGGVVSLSAGNISVNNNENLQLGNITTSGDTLNISTTGSSNITQVASTAINNTNASGTASLTLAAPGGDIILNNANNQVDTLNVGDGNTVEFTANSSIGIGSLKANSVSLTSSGSMMNVQGGSAVNITADSVFLSAVDGIGQGAVVSVNDGSGDFNITKTNIINLSTANLSVVNYNKANTSANPGSGNNAVFLSNNRDVTISDLRNNGDIYLNNTGTIELAVSPKVTNPNQGAIDANFGGHYTSGTYSDPTFAGNVAIFGTGTNSIFTQGLGNTEADITAQNLLVSGINQFGTTLQPIRLNIRNQFSLLTSGTGAVAYPFTPPGNVTTTADLTTYSGVNSLSGEQMINVESLGDVDPAIFTAVRNYDHEDVAILLPPDQRLGDDQDCSDNDKKCKKRHEAMN